MLYHELKLVADLDALAAGRFGAMLVVADASHTDFVHSADPDRIEKLHAALQAGGQCIGTIISEVGGESIIIKSNLFADASDEAALVMHALMEEVSHRPKGRIASRHAWEIKHINVQKRSKRREFNDKAAG